MYKREGKEKCDLPIGRVFNYLITLSTIYILSLTYILLTNVTNTNNIKMYSQLIILNFALKLLTVSEFLISLGRLFQATAPLQLNAFFR
jgi:hypothetical protein